MGVPGTMALSPTSEGSPPTCQPVEPQPGRVPRAFLCLWASCPAPATLCSCPSVTAAGTGVTRPPREGALCLS